MAYGPNESEEMVPDRPAPEEPASEPASPASELAEPATRLVAWLIDLLLYVVVAIAVAILGGIIGALIVFGGFSAFENLDENAFPAVILAMILFVLLPSLLSLIVVFIVQMVLLSTRGQTVGKIVMKIRVVDARTGEHPGWARLVLLRTIVNWFIQGTLNVLPGAGGIYFLVDSLFIFREDRRTIHDMIASTRVDKVAN